jgi:high-affinity iron transporter
MTVLQVVAWVTYLVVVLWAFLGKPAAEPAAAAGAPASEKAAAVPVGPGHWERLAGQRTWMVASVLVVVPALAAGTTIAALPTASGASSTVTVTNTSCGQDFTSAHAGTQTFTVQNSSAASGEINLLNASGGIVGEIETLGPATNAPLSVTLSSGTYTLACFMSGKAAMSSAPVAVSASGATTAAAPVAPKPVTLAELTPPNDEYRAYAAGVLVRLAADVAAIQGDLKRGDIAKAKADWLAAQLEWERVGASYDSFGQLGLNVDLLPTTLPLGVDDPGFIGLHRLEYGLWNGESTAELLPVASQLAANVTTVRTNLSSDDLAGDPTQLPIRAHEILEDALRDHLSGIDDQGAGAAFAMTYADLQVDQVVVGELAPLISSRQPGLLATITSQQATLARALLATQSGGRWLAPTGAPLAARQSVDSAIGALLETLSAVPDLLEVRPA